MGKNKEKITFLKKCYKLDPTKEGELPVIKGRKREEEIRKVKKGYTNLIRG